MSNPAENPIGFIKSKLNVRLDKLRQQLMIKDKLLKEGTWLKWMQKDGTCVESGTQ